MSRFSLRPAAIAIGLALCGSGVFANDAMPLPDDASELDASAYAVLEKHCARCHQDGALKPGLTKAKSGFGHVLDIRRLAQDAKYVVQGDVAGSKLHNVMGPYSYPAMPDDCTEDTCYPTQAEMDTVSTWIEALADTAPPPRPHVGLAELYALAHADLTAQPANRHDRIRYFSLRTLHNDSDVSDENLAGYRAATIKLLNALSWNATVYRAEPVDPHGVLIRVFLPDLNWNHEKWGYLEAVYPYAMTSETDPHLGQLQYLAGTRMPIIRADWFASRASVSPLYYDMLGLPDTVAGLERLLRIDLVRNIRDEQVVRAGFQDSGVSTNNRMIERHPLGTGFFWTSYDFAGSQGRQSFFEYPLGPTEAYGDDLAFHHDGGESIFTLPNGFHAYYLNTADGTRLNVGPTQIVRDDDYTDGTGEVVNGISCISCHIKGMRVNQDQVREVALADLSLPAAARQTIAAVYPGQDEVDKWLTHDTQAFYDTLESAGIPHDTTAGGLEPVRGLFVYHVDHFIDFDQAANELGLTPEELRARNGFVGPDMASLMLRLDQSPIARDEWTSAFPVLLARLTDYRPILTPAHAATKPLPYSVSAAVGDYHVPTEYVEEPPANPYKPGDPGYVAKPGDPGYVAKPGDPDYIANPGDPDYAGKPVPTVPYDAKVHDAPDYDNATYDDAAHNTADYDPPNHSVPTRGKLTVYTDKPAYKVGEGLIIYVEPRHDCRLTLISIDDRHQSCVLFPDPRLPDHPVKAGERFVFPPRGSLRTSAPGVETILAICNADRNAVTYRERDVSKVSCDPSQRADPYAEVTYDTVAHEVLVLDLDGPEKVADSGVPYRGLSTHNPHLAKAQISVPVTGY